MTLPILKLREGDARFSMNPAESFTMPARFYIHPDIFEMEKEAIFYKNWWCMGHKSQVSETGKYLTAQLHEQNVFVIRDRAGELKAFYNVCAHRGHELLDGSGHTNLIVCPYHAWSFDLDGSLKAARNTESMDNFNKCDFSLKPVRVEVFCGFVFVNLDPDAIPLKEQTGELEDEMRYYCPQIDTLEFAQRDTYDVPCNWKVMVDNFLECYHCHTAHKDFVDLVDMDSYRTKVHGIHSSQLSDAPKSTTNNAYHFEKGEVDFGYAGWFLWPNLTIWCYPGEPNISTLQMLPAGVDRCIEYQDWYVPGGKASKQLQDAMDYQKDVLQPEDVALCIRVQKGLKSKGYNQGHFVIDKEWSELSEHAVHHFQSLVVKALGAELE